MRSLRSLPVVAALLLVAVACTSAKPGWTYAPAPSVTPLPSVSPSGSAGPSPSAPASASASVAPSASASASAGAGEVLEISAQNIAFDTAQEVVPAGTPFQIHFVNNDAGIPHDVAIRDASGGELFKGETFPGVDERTYDVPAIPAGEYTFVCTVHPNMTGTLTSE
jgi:plastocyanin